jgi:hypothetical protein
MALVSTVPAAVATLQGYMATVAAASTVTDVQVYVGYSTARSGMSYNFMMVGDYQEGIVVAPDTYTWADIPGAAKRRTESYALQGCIQTWSGGTDVLGRLNDAYSLLNGLHELIVTDIGGSGSLSPSGSWGGLVVTMDANGPLETTAGWGVVLGFQLHVINAQIIG